MHKAKRFARNAYELYAINKRKFLERYLCIHDDNVVETKKRKHTNIIRHLLKVSQMEMLISNTLNCILFQYITKHFTYSRIKNTYTIIDMRALMEIISL